MFREWDGFYFAFAVEFNHRFRYFSKRFRVSGTTVENTGNAILPTLNVHGSNIAHIDEITAEVLTAGK